MFKEVGKGSQASGDTYVLSLVPQGLGHCRVSRPLFISQVLSVFIQERKRAILFPTTWREETTFQER